MARDRKASDRRYAPKRKDDPDHRFRETRLWRRISKQVRARDPICKMCEARGIITESSEVDHIIPPRGVWELQVGLTNLQGLRTSCHAVKTRAQAHGQPTGGFDVDGFPVRGTGHHWNREPHRGEVAHKK